MQTMAVDKALVALVAIVSFLYTADSAPSLETISDYAKVSKNDRPTATTEASVGTTSMGLASNETTDFVEYEDFDDIEEDRSLKQVSSGESMLKLITGLISLMGLLQTFKNANHQSSLPPKLNPQKRNLGKNENEPRKMEISKRIQEVQERFLPSQQANNNDNEKDQEFQPVENYPPYNPITANSAESYMKKGKKTSYEVYNDQNTIDHYNHKDEVEIIPSYSYEIQYETPKPVKQSHESPSGDEMSWNDHNIRPVYQPWMSKPKTNPQQSFVDSYLPWAGTPQDAVKPQTDSVVDSQPPWQGKLPPDDFQTYKHNFKNPPLPPPPALSPHDHHFEYEEMDHPEDHPVEEDRVNKKPYSYYFLGRKLWYIPLLFSVYFIVYIGALVLKSVARHKIQFPEKIWDLHDEHHGAIYGHGKTRRHRKIDEVTETVEKSIEKMKNKFM